MALVRQFEQRAIERPSQHRSVRGTYSIIRVEGEDLLQLDTYGSDDREIPGKVSQSLQFGPEARAQLRRLLEQFD